MSNLYEQVKFWNKTNPNAKPRELLIDPRFEGRAAKNTLVDYLKKAKKGSQSTYNCPRNKPDSLQIKVERWAREKDRENTREVVKAFPEAQPHTVREYLSKYRSKRRKVRQWNNTNLNKK